MKRFAALLAPTLAVVLLLFVGACGDNAGSDGATGPQGPPGPQLPATAQESCAVCHGSDRVADVDVVHGIADSPLANVPAITALTVTFNSVSITSGSTVLNFSLADQNGDPVTGLDNDTVQTDRNLRFTIARLFTSAHQNASSNPATGDASYWMSYYYRSGSPQYDRDGTLVETATLGTYNFTSSVDVFNSVTAPTTTGIPVAYQAVTYDANATHRIGLQVRGGGLPSMDTTVTFVPATGLGSGVVGGGDATGVTETRDIVESASCDECHGTLSIHGGRHDTKFCVTCHNPGNVDDAAPFNVDMKVFIHKIHRGRYLPSVVAGGTFAVGSHDWSDVGFPQFPLDDGAGIQNCAKCHTAADAGTPDGDNWKSVPTIEACTSCHDTLNITSSSTTHTGGQQTDNSGCANSSCHGSTASNSPANAHSRGANNAPSAIAAEVAKIQYVISSATYSKATGQLTVVFYAENPSDSSKYDLDGTTGAAAFRAANGGSLSLNVAWDTSKDIYNRGTTSYPASAISVDVLSGVTAGTITASSSVYTAVITMPSNSWAAGSGMVYLQGHPVGDVAGDGTANDRLPVPNVSATFAIQDSTPTARRAIVDIAKCNECHGVLSLHGNNRTNNIEVCASCHNPSNTDVEMRPATAAAAVDGKAEESIDFKRMIHAIHGAGKRETPITIYGYHGSVNTFTEEDITYPGVLNNCETCHLSGTYTLPLKSYVQGSTIDSGADEADQGDDLNISPTAAVCSSCHDTGVAQGHMEDNGASWEVTEGNITTF